MFHTYWKLLFLSSFFLNSYKNVLQECATRMSVRPCVSHSSSLILTETCTCTDNYSTYMCELNYKAARDCDNNPEMTVT